LLWGRLYLAEKKVGYCFDVAFDSDRLLSTKGAGTGSRQSVLEERYE
jgi:hypothetical protein